MLMYSARALLAQGERARAEDFWRELRELAERTHVAAVRRYASFSDFELAIIDGPLEGAWAHFKGIGDQAAGLGTTVFLIAPSLYLGRAQTWLEDFDQGFGPAAVAQPDRHSPSSIRLSAGRALCLAQVGRIEEARTLVAPLLDNIEGMDDEFPFGALALLLESAVVLEHRAAARALTGRLERVAHLNGDTLLLGCVALHLGNAAALVGDPTAAHGYYAHALESAGKIRFRPELALTHVSLAELLLHDGDETARSEALEHLDLAIPELRDMKMQPGLERALALRENVATVVARAPARESASDVLTAREREIASLMADGLSNRGIASKLVISEGTVDVHVKHILSKLGFRSRTQVAGWVARQDPG
jgi:ATP/maltotriose-dependent transcriptional regulator MalT